MPPRRQGIGAAEAKVMHLVADGEVGEPRAEVLEPMKVTDVTCIPLAARSPRPVLFAIGVDGVPAIHVEEALWTCGELLRGV